MSARGAGMKQLRGGNEPWKRKFEGKSRLYEQELHNTRRRCYKTENYRSSCKIDANEIAKLVIGGSGSGMGMTTDARGAIEVMM